jgi:hypothetical protein
LDLFRFDFVDLALPAVLPDGTYRLKAIRNGTVLDVFDGDIVVAAELTDGHESGPSPIPSDVVTEEDSAVMDVGPEPIPTLGPLTLFPATLTFNLLKGDTRTIAPQVVTLSNPGPGTMEWLALEDELLWMEPSAGMIEPNGEAQILVSPVPGIQQQEGTMATVLLVLAPDAANGGEICEVTINVGNVTVDATPKTLRFSWMEGGKDPIAQSIVLSRMGMETLPLAWSIQAGEAPWLEVGPMSGTFSSEPTALSVAVRGTGLKEGIYTASFEIHTPGAQNSPLTIHVELEVGTLTVGPSEVHASIPQGGGEVLALAVRSTLGAWSIQEDCSWLELSSLEGAAAEAASEVSLFFSAAGLEPGAYWSVLEVSSSEMVIPVMISMDVLPVVVPLAAVTPSDLAFIAMVGDSLLPGKTLKLTIEGTEHPMEWNVTADVPWVAVSPSSGAGEGEVLVSIDATSLEAGVYGSMVKINAPAAANGPISIPLSLVVSEPVVESAPAADAPREDGPVVAPAAGPVENHSAAPSSSGAVSRGGSGSGGGCMMSIQTNRNGPKTPSSGPFLFLLVGALFLLALVRRMSSSHIRTIAHSHNPSDS